MLSRLALGFILISLCGCSDGGSEKALFNVSGSVVNNGTPVGEGTVSFWDASTGSAGSVEMGPDSTFSIDLPPGSYGVSVQPPETSGEESEFTDADTVVVPTELIPREAFTAESTGIVVPVKNSDVDNLEFDLGTISIRKSDRR